MLVLALGIAMAVAWLYNLLSSMGRHTRRLPAILHVLWLLATAIFIFVGAGEVAGG